MLIDKKLSSLKDKLYGEKPEAPVKEKKVKTAKVEAVKKLGKSNKK
jgi:hypothetical protein